MGALPRTVGIILNGVTGRMGTNQHLVRSILAIRAQGGVALPDGDALVPEPVLLGRNEGRLRALSEAHGGLPWSTDLEAALRDPANQIYFDAQVTHARPAAVRAALAAGRHVYCEKPLADDLGTSLELARLAREAGVKNGVVQDKLFLPGPLKLRRLVDEGFFGRILAVRLEFGYWVFDGAVRPAQRPSWNYRREDGGGIILDMLCHWRYLLDGLFAPVQGVFCLGATHIAERRDERGQPYASTADDAAYATLALEGGIIAQVNSSWSTRVRRDDLLTVQVDGTGGSAVAGLHRCFVQHAAHTPRAVWNPDVATSQEYRDDWVEVPDDGPPENAFKAQWELFLRHVAAGTPFRWDFREAAKGVQLAELGLRSWRERRWLEVPPLEREA